MFRIHHILVFIFMLGISGVSAGELTPKIISEGKNEIELKVLNTLSRDLLDIHFEVGEIKLPGWLDIEIPREILDIPAGQKGGKPFILSLIVSEAPSDAVFELPLKLKEKNGNEWDYSILLKVNKILPAQFNLFQNTPNPFNPVTMIRYTLHEPGPVNLNIYDMIGRLVVTLVDESQKSGSHEIYWDGVDTNGARVSSGIYFYRLRAGGMSETRRMVFMK